MAARPAPPQRNISQTIYVRNINYNTETKTLVDAFSKFGPVQAVRIITGFDGRQPVSLGFAFIEFTTVEGYAAALGNPDQLIVDGRPLGVAESRPARQRKRDTAFVLGIPRGTTVEDLRAVFTAYNPTDVRIVREGDGDRQRGYAFVTFATEDDQTRAVTDHRDAGIALNGGTSIVRYARPRNASAGRRFFRPAWRGQPGRRADRAAPLPDRGPPGFRRRPQRGRGPAAAARAPAPGPPPE
jgi:RNA recognition motif-containing protein